MLSSHGIPAKGGTCLGRMDDNIHPGASRETPLVMLSEASVAVRRNPAHAAGFYLTKPSYPSIFKSMIELKKVSYEYKLDDKQSILALDDINLTFEKGKSVAIIGSNGSGKTTLARLLNALLLPSSGQVIVDGSDTQDKDSQKLIRLKVGMVFQNPDNQLISTSVEREIAFGLENLALPYEEMGKRVRWALYFFHLKEYMNYPPHKLSGGEKQRVALASVLSMQPEYLVLDEPTSLLDPKGKKEVMNQVQRLSKQKNMTVIHITQFPEEAIIADRVLVMHKGRIVLDGTPQDVFKQKEKLRKIGLQAPLAFELGTELSQGGVIPSGDYLTMDDLIEKLPSNIKSVKRKPAPKTNQINLEFAHPVPNLKIPPNGNGSKNIESSSSNSPFQILVENLSFIYNQGLPTKRKALDGINLKIKKGDFIGLVGPTGSGKTTLVQHLNALLFPTSGRVILEGVDLSARFKGKDKSVDLRKIRQKAGLVFQFPELQLFEDTVYDDIAFGPKNLGLTEEKIKERVQSSMSKVGLDFDEFASRSPFSLSGGEQRKVAIAGVLAQEPEVLILDEPTCGLDSKSTEEIKKLLTDLNTNGVTVILISHNMDLIAELAQKIILLDHGRVVSFCRKEDFFKDSERIKSIGLDLPEVTEFVRMLKEKGIEVRTDIFTKEEVLALFDNLECQASA
jgi:energy-coupling factor transporter ATPase